MKLGLLALAALALASMAPVALADAPPRTEARSDRAGLIAYLRPARKPPHAIGERLALWVRPIKGGPPRLLLSPRYTEDPKTNLTDMNNPTFSLDGRSIYVLAHGWVTSDGVHRVEVATGRLSWVTAGNSVEVVRNGPYAGDLVVSSHRYFREGGSHDPAFLMRPDGRELLMIPGSDAPDDRGRAWLRAHHWTAD